MADKHPVSMLQELMARQRLELPRYEIADISTRTNPRFRCTVQVAGITTSTESSSKQIAKKQAASQAINLLGFDIRKTPTIHPINYNAIGMLNEYTAQKRLPYPTYVECGANPSGEFIISCEVHQYTCEAHAPTKKHAKQLAAHHMLQKLQTQGTNITMPVVKAEISNDDVIKKFKELSIENANAIRMKIESTEINPVHHSLNDSNENQENTNDSVNQEDLMEIMERIHNLNVAYSVSIISKNPCTVVLKFDDEQKTTILEADESYDVAHYKVFKKALMIVSAIRAKENGL